MKFHVETLGCKVNQVDSEELIDNLIKKGHEFSNKSSAELIVINTCTVTSKADSKSLSAIKRSINNVNSKFVFVTGCYSELEKNILEKTEGINGIIKHTEKKQAVHFIEKKIAEKKIAMGDYLHSPSANGVMHKIVTSDLNSNQTNYYKHTRAFLKVQDGCNAFCTYCRIPYARGVPVSRDYDNIIQQVKNLSQKGIPEVVLTGVNIGDYNSGGNDFEKLLRGILSNAGNMLVRVSTIEPHSITGGVIDALDHPNVSKHIHLALQGGVDSQLEKMNRKYTTTEFLNIVTGLRKIDTLFAITSDVITGFCGETLDDFDQSVAFIKKCAFAKLHVFPYSPRPLTKAFYYRDDVSSQEKKRRVSILLHLSQKMADYYVKKVGEKPHRFIVEQANKSLRKNDNHGTDDFYYQGTSEYYLKGLLKVKYPLKPGPALMAKIVNESPNVFEPI